MLYKFLSGQAGSGYAEHHAELCIFVERHAALPQVFAAALHHTHGCVPVLHIRHHGEHHPQWAAGGGAQQRTELRLELVGLAQTVADAPQAKLGRLQALIGVGNGAV